MNTIPYFYFDIMARIIPGGLLLASFKVIGLRAPSPWGNLFIGEGWKAAVVPLIFLATAYFLGIAWDGAFRFSTLAKRFGRYQYKRVHEASEREGLQRDPVGASSTDFQHELWKWLALVAGPSNAAAFSLAHRFQAESRLLILSSLPASFLTGFCVSEWLKFCGSLLVAVALALGVLTTLIWAAFNSEENRWIWALAAARHLKEDWPARWKSDPSQPTSSSQAVAS